MSDLNVTPTTDSSALGVGAVAKTTTPAKPAKSRGLSYYNRFACGAAALLAFATGMILFSTQQSAQSAEDMRNEAHATLQQAGEELAPYWCSQITPDNKAKFEELYDLYLDGGDEIQAIVNQQCQTEVAIAKVVSRHTPNVAFDASSECIINQNETKVACTVTVTASDSLKSDLAPFSSTSLTLKMGFSTISIGILPPTHDVGDVSALTMDSSGTATTQFELDYDPSWGQNYAIYVKSFYPNK